MPRADRAVHAPPSDAVGGRAPASGAHREPGSRAMAPRDVRAARAFYRDALRGRQAWPTRLADGRGSLWFLVGGTLLEVSPEARVAATPIVLEVDDPCELAERCWDAGFGVMVDEEAEGCLSLSVVDPFGRRVVLLPRTVGR